MPIFRLAFLVIATSACIGTAGDSSIDSAVDEPTWYGEIQPLIENRCAYCHQPESPAPFPLTTYDEVVSVLDAVATVVDDGSMPPWAPDGECNDYLADRSLNAEQISTLLAWAAAGAPLGDERESGKPLDPMPSLSRIDLTLSMVEAYTPTEVPDDYRCFLLDWPLETDTYVTGFSTEPGDLSMVHHATGFIVPPETVESLQAREQEDEAYGYACPGGPGPGTEWVAGWSPGTQGTDFPEGTGIRVNQGAKMGFQVHYHTTDTDTGSDLSSMQFKIDAKVERPAWIFRIWDPAWLLDDGMKIPAEEKETIWSYEKAVPAGLDVLVYSANLHMHTLGTSTRLEVVRADGSSDCLLSVPDWDFDWQGDYFLETPLEAYDQERFYMECRWDNSEGTENVYWGEGTLDEMCTAKIYMTNQ